METNTKDTRGPAPDKIHYHVPGGESAVDPSIVKYMKKIEVGDGGRHVAGIHVHVNTRWDGHKCGIPEGFATALEGDAPISTSYLSEDMFSQVIVTPVLPRMAKDCVTPLPPYNEAYFQGRSDALARALGPLKGPAAEGAGPRLSRASTRSAGGDVEPWQPFLGDGWATVGWADGAQGEEREWYIIVYVPRTRASLDLFSRAEAMASAARPASLAAFVGSREYRAAERMSERNARRLVCAVADALGVRVTYAEDAEAALAEHDDEPPRLADALCRNTYNYVWRANRPYPGTPLYVVCDHCTPTPPSTGITFLTGPGSGVYVYLPPPNRGRFVPNDALCTAPLTLGAARGDAMAREGIKSLVGRLVKTKKVRKMFIRPAVSFGGGIGASDS